MLTASRLHEFLIYDPNSGIFRRKINSGPCLAGTIAGSINKKGYVAISVGNKVYYAHRLAWLWMTGLWPKQIDHKDLNKSNNRWDNLRECSNSENRANQKVRCDNKSGLKGASLNGYKWRARITYNKTTTRLGPFDSAEEAHAAYAKAALKLFQEYARFK